MINSCLNHIHRICDYIINVINMLLINTPRNISRIRMEFYSRDSSFLTRYRCQRYIKETNTILLRDITLYYIILLYYLYYCNKLLNNYPCDSSSNMLKKEQNYHDFMKYINNQLEDEDVIILD